MNLGEMRRLLDSRGILLTKSLGQNFLHDSNQLRKIAEAGEISKDDRILEIGPGLGPLTRLLLDRSREVLAVELDQRLVAILKERFEKFPNLRLKHADGLDLVRQPGSDWTGWKLISNLPYSVGSPILVELALHEKSPCRIVATLQHEVVERLVAGPEDDAYGVLSLLVGLRYQVKGFFKIPADCFFPAPDVTSACVTLVIRPQPLMAPSLEPVFVRVVKRAFSQRRKMMKKLLKAEWPLDVIEESFGRASIPATARAEELGIEKFVELTGQLTALKDAK